MSSPLTDLERSIIAKVSMARFPPATASKRFIRDLESGQIRQLSHNGRRFFAYVANRFRRQYQLTTEELQWVAYWLSQPYESKQEAKPRKVREPREEAAADEAPRLLFP